MNGGWKWRTGLLLAAALSWSRPCPAADLAPMEYFNSLVAGSPDPGDQDGAFYQARFNHPAGLAFDDTGNLLFVADHDNHRIRAVHLDGQNRVETLCGTGQPGHLDGPLDKATFNQPMALAFIPPHSLVVYDEGDRFIRWVDLAQKSVTTLQGDAPDGTMGDVWEVAYHPKDGNLYFTRPNTPDLCRWNPKSRKWETVLKSDPLVPHPMGLASSGDALYVADRDLPKVYRVDLGGTDSKSKVEASLAEAGQGDHILRMAWSDGMLYARQSGKDSLAVVAPTYRPVTLASAWGFFLTNDNPGMEPFLSYGGYPAGLAASPLEKRKLYLDQPGRHEQSIVSVKDYDFADRWNARSLSEQHQKLTDFEYPPAKPPRTFRILVAGNSRTITAPPVRPEGPPPGDDGQFKVHTFPKQLEFMLNSQASLEGNPGHFEVLNVGHAGFNTQYYAYYEVPDLVKKYDLDLVMILVGPYDDESISDYYVRPITPEGIPAHETDPEYLLKPVSKRVSSDIARKFLALCRKKKWVATPSPTQVSFVEFGQILQSGDAEAREDLVEMLGKPLGLLSAKLKGCKTNAGTPVKFFICFAPTGDQKDTLIGDYESFWKEVCLRQGWPLMDLTDSYDVLQTPFYPDHEACCHHHYTIYGNALMAYLLDFYMVKDGWLPWGTAAGKP